MRRNSTGGNGLKEITARTDVSGDRSKCGFPDGFSQTKALKPLFDRWERSHTSLSG